VFREGTALEALESVDSRRFFPHALAATLLVIVAPALVVVALSPLSGLADLLLSALLATGLSVAAGSALAALWTRQPQSREIPFGDLMLWSWARRVRAERRLAKATADGHLSGSGGLAELRTLAVVFEAGEGFSHGHSGRVARHAERIARRLGLPAEEVERIEAAAAVHDVGMLGVPRSVRATDERERGPEERALLEHHAVDGAERVATALDAETAALVRHHHERVDGNGYPDGLAGVEIPLGARIIAVADRFDELISPASRQAPASRRNALDELSARAGTELDAAVVAAFVGYYSGVRSIAGVAFAATAPQRAVRWIAAAPATIGSAISAPVAIQGLCAAGATVVAGACIGGLPALTPSGGERSDAQQQAGQGAGEAGGGGSAVPLAVAPTPGERDGARGGSGDRQPGDDRRDRGSDSPGSDTPQQAPSGGDGGGAPTTPVGGGGGGQSPVTGGGGGGGSTPSVPSTPLPEVDLEVPQVEAPQLPSNPVTQVVDPVLDGVSETLPPVKPVTETVKGVVGGLIGGLGGGGQ
jgi:HD-GYP domain-containing protein (c-di-GMP phosphodiesterase class II)